ncbi:MFS transporter [Micropruina sonneratiae]|uniref:MFS transporter n=1 Tax=Micropruina sonneratiae TaxID=2986940 RepID=UPI0022266756|nr:MFS transporter [Micropruina sp. KQZ13P-5]MCW3156444.1 MFS transporter [Micropruina sp. KQZ13P-5]
MDAEAVEIDDAGPGVIAAFRSVWRHRRWRWLAGSTVVSLFGDTMYVVAIIVVLLEGDNGAAWLSAGLLARLLPYVILGPIGGVVADRFDRRLVMVVLSAGRMVLFVALAVLVATDGPTWTLIVLLAISAAAGAFFFPARGAAIPQLVPENDLAAANAAENGLSQLSWFFGPALGALLLAVVSPAFVLAIEAVTFAVEAAMLWQIGALPVPKGAADEDAPGGSLFAQTWDDIREGAGVVFTDRGLRALTLLNGAACIAFGAEQVLYVLVADQKLGLGPEGFGYILTAMGVGGMIAAPLSARAGSSPHAARWLLGSGVLLGVPMIAVALLPVPAVVFGISVIEGAAAVVFDVVALTLLQRGTPEAAMGRVFSLSDAVSTLGQTIGSVGAPALVAVVGLGLSLQLSGALMLVFVAALTPALLYLVARTDAERRRVEGLAAELGRVPALASFEPVDLERLARATTLREVPAGTPVIVAGAEPDDLYVVRSGALEVVPADAVAGAERPPELVAGDLFGEIGLLRGVNRTATVTALRGTELLAIQGSTFQAVAAPGPSAELVLGGMRTRLRRTHPQLLDAVDA